MSTIREQKFDGVLFLIIGPSGVGKGTLVNMLRDVLIKHKKVVSHTTRKKRPGESEGDVYHFITKEDFVRDIEKGEYLEWACVHQDNYYGIPLKPVMEILQSGTFTVREVDMQGYEKIIHRLPRENVVSIFLMTKTLETLKRRILRRGKLPDEEIERRMESARKELAKKDLCDYRVFNYEGKLEECFEEVLEIILKEAAARGIKI